MNNTGQVSGGISDAISYKQQPQEDAQSSAMGFMQLTASEGAARPGSSSQNRTNDRLTDDSNKLSDLPDSQSLGRKSDVVNLNSFGLPSDGASSDGHPLNRKTSDQGSSTQGSNKLLNPLMKNEDSNMEDDNMLLDEESSKQMQDRELYKSALHKTFRTVINYITSDIKKKKRSFRIGVFTIFLVVSFIMMLKALVDIAPIAFLKVG